MSANDPAFPVLERNWNPDREEWEYSLVGGLTKREYFAGLCLQGIMASCSPEYEFKSYGSYEEAASNAVRLSDALIKALGESHV